MEDHCAALLLVLEKGSVGESYNVGASNEQSNIALVDRICSELEEIKPTRLNQAMRVAHASSYQELKQFVADRPGHDRRYAVDASKIQRDLGWRPRRTFVEGLRETVRWYVEHQDWFAETAQGDRRRLGLGAVSA